MAEPLRGGGPGMAGWGGSGRGSGRSSGGETSISASRSCRCCHRAGYRRASRLFHELALARADGTYVRLLAKLARLDVLGVDDWGLAPVQDPERRDFLEILEDRRSRISGVTRTLVPRGGRALGSVRFGRWRGAVPLGHAARRYPSRPQHLHGQPTMSG